MIGRGYLGGGSIAAALGLSPFATPLDAYCEITGEMSVDLPVERREFFDRRKAWEPMAREIFQRKVGAIIVRFNERYNHPSLPWGKAEIDAETSNNNNVEFKSLRPEVRWMWPIVDDDPQSAEPPMYVAVQGVWGMAVVPSAMGVWVHALDLDNDLIYWMERDEELIAQVEDGAKRFWTNHVEKRRAPLPTDVAGLLRMYGKGTPRSVEATPEIRDALVKREKAVSSIKINEADQLSAELAIKQYMRDASELTINGRTVATWRSDTRGIRSFRTKTL